MTNLQKFKNELFEVEAKEVDGQVLFDAEMIAKSLGLTEFKNNKEYVMWRRVNQHLTPFGTSAENSPQVGKGSFIPESMVYKLAFKASNELAEKFQDWLAIEVIPSIRKNGYYKADTSDKKESFELQLLGVKAAIDILKVDEASKVIMIEKAHIEHGVPTSHLPKYVEGELKVSLSQLLKDNNVPLSALKFNKKLIELGLLEEKERPSSNGGKKKFKSLTDKGKLYGDNVTSTRNTKETQPLYYPSKFNELLKLVS